MLDAPFYCRSAIRTTIDGETSVGVHEALDLDRFRETVAEADAGAARAAPGALALRLTQPRVNARKEVASLIPAAFQPGFSCVPKG